MNTIFRPHGPQTETTQQQERGGSLPHCQETEEDGLCYQGERLCLKQQTRTYSIDFEQSYRQGLKRKNTQDDLLLRSFKGIPPEGPLVDTCCGLGDDLMVIRTAFKKVIGLERHPILYALLKDAQKRFSLGGVEILFQDSRSYKGPGEVFYMDPMYPSLSRKKSLAPKRIELLKKLCGQDEDAEDLLRGLLDKGAKRIVLKRPLKSPVLIPLKRQRALSGKLIRFDIY